MLCCNTQILYVYLYVIYIGLNHTCISSAIYFQYAAKSFIFPDTPTERGEAYVQQIQLPKYYTNLKDRPIHKYLG